MNRTGFVIAGLILLGAIGYAQSNQELVPSARLVTVTNFPNPQHCAGSTHRARGKPKNRDCLPHLAAFI